MGESNVSTAGEPKGSSNPLSVRNFRLLWIGESVSLLGDQFALIALPWLVLQLTDNALALGLVMALSSIPRAVFMLIGGAFVDRFSPRHVMFTSNLARMILVLGLTGVILADRVELWMLYVFGLAFGLADAFFIPAQSAIVPQVLDEKQLQTGNALVQGMAQLSLFLGPVLAGAVIAVVGGSAKDPSRSGIGLAFGLDGLSFLASVVALYRMQVSRPVPTSDQPAVLDSIKEGLKFVWDSMVLRLLFIVVMGINFFVVGPFSVGVPVLADDRLSGGAAAFGIIMSAFGGGALAGIILAGVLPRPRAARFGTILLVCVAMLGVGLMALPISDATAIVAVISLLMGVFNGYVNILAITWLQKRIPEALMGRVMSLIMFASLGLVPVSSALSGAILDLNIEALFVGSGVMMIVVAMIALRVPALRLMGLEAPEIEEPTSIGDVLRQTSEIPALRTTTELPVVKL